MDALESCSVPLTSWQHATRAFRHQPYRLFFVGQLISLLGTWSQAIALSWLVWRMTHSAVWLGAIGFAEQFPILIFGLFGGVVADRSDRLQLLTLTQVLCMINAIAMAILTLTGRIQPWHIVALSTWLGTTYAFEFPIRQAFVMDMVGKEDTLNAVALSGAMIHGTRMLGPMAAGAIIAWKGEGPCFIINALSFLVLIAALLTIDRRQLFPTERQLLSSGKAIREILSFTWYEPEVRLVTFVIGVLALTGFLYVFLLPMLADRTFGGTAVELSWLTAASGAGALAGAVALALRRGNQGLLLLCMKMMIVFSVVLLVFSQVKNLWVGMMLLASMGYCSTIFFSGINSFLQYKSPSRLRGRMMSLFVVVLLGLMPIAGLGGGFVAQAIGAGMTIAIGAVLSLAVGIFGYARALRFQ